MPGDKAIEIAFHLQIELSTRVATNRLPEGQGLLGEALDSLATVLDRSRNSLAELKLVDQGGEVTALVAKLGEVLAPFLAEWHPRLSEHESARPRGTDVLTHESAWEHARELRDELTVVQDSSAEILEGLRYVTGADI